MPKPMQVSNSRRPSDIIQDKDENVLYRNIWLVIIQACAETA